MVREYEAAARRMLLVGALVLAASLAGLALAAATLLSREEQALRDVAAQRIDAAFDDFIESLAAEDDPGEVRVEADDDFREIAPSEDLPAWPKQRPPRRFAVLPEPADPEERFLLRTVDHAEDARLADAALSRLSASPDPATRLAAGARLARASLAAGGDGIIDGWGHRIRAVFANVHPDPKDVLPPPRHWEGVPTEFRATPEAAFLGRLAGEAWATEVLTRALGTADAERALATLVAVPPPLGSAGAELRAARGWIAFYRERADLAGRAQALADRSVRGRRTRFVPQDDGSAILAVRNAVGWTVRRISADVVSNVSRRVLAPLGISLRRTDTIDPSTSTLVDLGSGFAATRAGRTEEAGGRSLLPAGIAVAGIAALAAFVAFVRGVRRESKAAADRADFVATVSHELRTPVAVVRTAAETLLTGRAVRDEDRRQLLEAILRESERLSGLVGNVLDFSRIDAGTRRYALRETNLEDVIEETVRRTEPARAAAGFRVEIDLPSPLPSAVCDADAIGAALANLLDNAVKFRGASDHATVRATATMDAVTIEVEDHGVGVPDDEKRHVFERFFRGGAAAVRETRGSGIGLSLVQHAAEAHGGRAEVRDTPGGGATFRIVIPVVQPPRGSGEHA